jgi:hypothetical protein
LGVFGGLWIKKKNNKTVLKTIIVFV